MASIRLELLRTLVAVCSNCCDILCINANEEIVSTYLAYPKHKKTENAILYLTDIFGVQLINNQL